MRGLRSLCAGVSLEGRSPRVSGTEGGWRGLRTGKRGIVPRVPERSSTPVTWAMISGCQGRPHRGHLPHRVPTAGWVVRIEVPTARRNPHSSRVGKATKMAPHRFGLS